MVAGGSAPPALMIIVPLAIVAALALVGGLVALHIAATQAAALLAFCPVANFVTEPMTSLVRAGPYMAFPDDLPVILDDGLDGGMPECHDLKSVVLPTTKCDPSDKECAEHACREKCCEDESCTFYQFSTDPIAGDALQEVVCHLGEKHQLVDTNCEKPFFGEVCVSRLPIWQQEGKDHMKCLSGYGAGEGFLVDDQMDCQETAMANGDCFYQYNEDQKTCATCKDLSDISTSTIDNWRVYKDAKCGTGHVIDGAACSEWSMKKVLLYKVTGTEEVRPLSRICRGNNAQCLKKRCRQECSTKSDCTFYQYQEGENICFLGTAETLSETDVHEPHFGGFVTADRKCKSGFQCPSSNTCVDECTECEGYSQNGPVSRGRARSKRAWCVRSAVESLCYEDNWVASYRGLPVDEWCSGTEKVTVNMAESLDARESGDGICAKACCSDPYCAVYQMRPADATKKGSDFKKGDTVECWLGLETAGGKPNFKCTGRKLKRWRAAPAPMGRALAKRGCTDGSSACLTKNACVDHCRTECMGANMFNATIGVCEPDPTEEKEKLEWADDATHRHAFKDNIQHAFPKVATKNTDNAYYVEHHATDKSKFVEQDAILQLQLNSHKVAHGNTMDMASACGSLKDDDDDTMMCWHDDESVSCKCEFMKKQSCNTWFHDEKHMKHVLEDVGVLVFPGDKCVCSSTPNTNGEFHCTFGLLETLPLVKADKDDVAALQLAGSNSATCTPGKCDSAMGTTGEVVRFGSHNCGYSYAKDGEEYYCDSKCNCHKELSPSEVDMGKLLADDTCSDQVCTNMATCSTLDYGSYGCGYSCENADGVFYFCTQDCQCEADE